MKTVLFVGALLFCVMTYVATAYTGEKEDLITEYNNLKNRVEQAESAIVQLKTRMTEIVGVVKYLDAKKAKEKDNLEEVIKEIEKEEAEDGEEMQAVEGGKKKDDSGDTGQKEE